MNTATWLMIAWNGIKRLGRHLAKPETYRRAKKRIQEREAKNEADALRFANKR